MDGILIVKKEAGFTSRDIVNKVSKILNTKKIGHTGTLDPMATGVLVLCIGKATKLVEILTSNEKEYIAEATLGTLTDTLDISGNIIDEKITHITKEEILNTLKNMIGCYNQEVPIYSAVKIKGKKLYEYARNNQEVELPKRQVEIKKLELLGNIKYSADKTIFSFNCLVSKGTYIRSLIRDIARNLNTIGIMSKLERTKQGIFSINSSYTLKDIENGNYKLISIADCLQNYTNVIAPQYLIKKITNGAILENCYNSNCIVFKDENNNVLALYKTIEKDTSKIKPWKIF